MSDYADLERSIERSPVDLKPLDIDGPSSVYQASEAIDELNRYIQRYLRENGDREMATDLKRCGSENRELRNALGRLLTYVKGSDQTRFDVETLVEATRNYLEL